ncbi:MAG TPA: DUF748 domain-containing protein [Candidatus Dormibacteraeota bacterium]|nr:DUF748 domain-containing protein [Candidatus Dormibacteraeota bacterium]
MQRNVDTSHAAKPAEPPVRKRRRRWRAFFFTLVILVAVLGFGRAMLPWSVRKYVNRTLDRNELYEGRIGQVQIHLWRGAYSIHDIKIRKRTGNVPVPFFSAGTVDFSLEWKALLHHRVVGRLLMEQPEINFVDAPTEDEAQTGAGAPWLQMISDLFPFKINSTVIRDGTVHFRAYQKQTLVDVYLSKVEGTIDNLGNIRDQTNPLLATVQAKAIAMDQAKLDFKMTLDPFSYRPTFHMALRLVGLDVTKVNDLALAYGKFDFKRGFFDLVIETDAKEGQLTGYVKPLFRDLKVFSLAQDVKEDNPLQFLWQALVGAATSVFKNHPRDQFGTLIPFTGEASGATKTDILATIGNVIRNAFVRAYLPRLEGNQDIAEGIQFEAPEFEEHLATGGTD